MFYQVLNHVMLELSQCHLSLDRNVINVLECHFLSDGIVMSLGKMMVLIFSWIINVILECSINIGIDLVNVLRIAMSSHESLERWFHIL